MNAIELNTHEFKDLGGAQGFGRNYRGTEGHEETE